MYVQCSQIPISLQAHFQRSSAEKVMRPVLSTLACRCAQSKVSSTSRLPPSAFRPLYSTVAHFGLTSQSLPARVSRFLPQSLATASFSTQSSLKMPEDVEKAFHSVTDGEHPASHQLSSSTEGKHEWKTRPPYRVHDSNEHFEARYEANCHCERVKFQLSREEPLDSKLCHCTTCQTQHGMWSFSSVQK